MTIFLILPCVLVFEVLVLVSELGMSLRFRALKQKKRRPHYYKLESKCGCLWVYEHARPRSIDVAGVLIRIICEYYAFVVLYILDDSLDHSVREKEETLEASNEENQLVLVCLVDHQEVDEEEEHAHAKKGDQLHQENEPENWIAHPIPDRRII